jgi:hypothetical protein
VFYCFATQTKGRLKTMQALAVFRRPFYPPSFLFETQPLFYLKLSSVHALPYCLNETKMTANPMARLEVLNQTDNNKKVV